MGGRAEVGHWLRRGANQPGRGPTQSQRSPARPRPAPPGPAPPGAGQPVRPGYP